MLPTTILVDEAPRCVVRPTDAKALNRFIRNAKVLLLGDNTGGAITHRPADAPELARWRDALALHEACGGSEDEFFGVPL
ncbi:hypothetical protein [Candidatus Macondimonas diazotrophica]|jgi:hypothetical protein|uniref:Uncharacterized protein n=1 Tax=Candidatus Macondimonas diazotrophica TaxID=2305248 RepID=A0A4Z0F8J3_9GAMM|nr:hypothetical protein [Candidatus Macondimonas diazotrophica]NCU01846.1 hypothetical protein [Candidatus Macondimonas diazotrophica]TFZ81917.1 hypothetical protein E4680_10650 [Candidatus Macondimonas diazotrophica]